MTPAEHARRTLALALPVMLSRAGLLLLVLVDSAMTGQAGAEQLAFYGLGTAPQLTLMLIGIGALLGTVVLTAQAHGAGRSRDCGRIWRLALLHAFGYGVLMLLLSLGGERFLLLTGLSRALAAGGAEVLLVFACSLPAILMYIATTLFLEAIDRPLPGLVIMLVANLVNVLLNWLLIYGNGGLPELGAVGAAWATTAVRWGICAAIVGYVLFVLDRERYGLDAPLAGSAALGRRLRRIGYPMALSQGMESSAFAAMVLFAGLLGPLQVAAYQAVLSLISLVFMFSLGFATAASVRVANAVGRGDRRGVRFAGWIAAVLAMLVLAIWSLLFGLFPERLASIYTNDAATAAVTTAAIALAALVLIPDGLQAVLMGALRGMADVWPATLLFLISFWLVMIPTGYGIGVAAGEGAAGLVKGVLAGCVCAALLLGLRFRHIAGRARADASAPGATATEQTDRTDGQL